MAHDYTDELKRKLNITWDDAATDARIADILAQAPDIIATRLGLPIPEGSTASDAIAADPEAHALLISYCYYAWNHAEDAFWQSYLMDVYTIQNRLAVDAFLEWGGPDAP